MCEKPFRPEDENISAEDIEHRTWLLDAKQNRDRIKADPVKYVKDFLYNYGDWESTAPEPVSVVEILEVTYSSSYAEISESLVGVFKTTDGRKVKYTIRYLKVNQTRFMPADEDTFFDWEEVDG